MFLVRFVFFLPGEILLVNARCTCFLSYSVAEAGRIWWGFWGYLKMEVGVPVPISSMYGIVTYIYHKSQPNVGKYTRHGWYGVLNRQNRRLFLGWVPLHNRYPVAACIGEDIVSRRFDPWDADVYLPTWLNHEHASKFRYQLISYTVRGSQPRSQKRLFLRPQKQACWQFFCALIIICYQHSPPEVHRICSPRASGLLRRSTWQRGAFGSV